VSPRNLQELIDRRVTVEELRDALERPVDAREREEIVSLVQWFTRRYPSPAQRLAYVRRAYARWRSHVGGHVQAPRAEGDDVLGRLAEGEQMLARRSERRWQRAHAIARECPGVDPGDVYHALQCLELEPAERLRRGLSRGRLRAYSR
jgi:hypothetical protein